MSCGHLGPPLSRHPTSAEDGLIRLGRRGDEGARASTAGRLERLRYQEAERQATAFAWGRFLRLHPQGLFAERAQNHLANLRFAEAERQGRLSGYRRFLRLHPRHRLASKAWQLLVAEQGRLLLTEGNRASIVAFLARHPQSTAVAALRSRVESLDLQALSLEESIPALERFLRTHPSSSSGPAVRNRLEIRMAGRVAAFGDRAALRSFRERFPGSGHLARLDLLVFGREALEALRAGDTVYLRSALRERLPRGASAGSRVLGSWLQSGVPRLTALAPFFRGAAPFSPRGSLQALVAAVRLGDPPTAAFALRALSYLQSLPAVLAMVESVASPDTGVALEACKSLAMWTTRAPREPTRQLLLDLLAGLRERQDTAARVSELGILWALGERSGLLAALGARAWHRPWRLLPSFLWLEALVPGTAAAQQVGAQAVEALREELGRLGQMVPKELGEETRQRALSTVFELGAIGAAIQGLEARHPRGPEWVEKLRSLGEAVRQRVTEARQAFVTRFPEQLPADPAETDAAAKQHEAARQGMLRQLQGRIDSMGTPTEVRSILCAAIPQVNGFCPQK